MLDDSVCRVFKLDALPGDVTPPSAKVQLVLIGRLRDIAHGAFTSSALACGWHGCSTKVDTQESAWEAPTCIICRKSVSLSSYSNRITSF